MLILPTLNIYAWLQPAYVSPPARRPLGATVQAALWVVFYLSLPAVGGAEGISAGAAQQGP
jgi:hypothetical protein